MVRSGVCGRVLRGRCKGEKGKEKGEAFHERDEESARRPARPMYRSCIWERRDEVAEAFDPGGVFAVEEQVFHIAALEREVC